MTLVLSLPDKPKSSSGIAVEKLRELIFSGTLGAGTDHLESELADALGMSRTPVREALVTLEGQGLLEVRPRKGVRIKPISATDMEEIYDVLTELEALAAERAAQQGYDSSDLKTLKKAIDTMDAALAKDDLHLWAEGDESFHAELVRLGGNSRVRAIVGMMSDQVRRARLVTLHMRPKPRKSNADHRAVFDAISLGDHVTARKVHHEHRASAKEILLGLLRKHQLNCL
jgi:DNA-binding GntR family transcriptional regulator